MWLAVGPSHKASLRLMVALAILATLATLVTFGHCIINDFPDDTGFYVGVMSLKPRIRMIDLNPLVRLAEL